MDMLNDLDPLLRIYWYIALPASLIFVVQIVMTFTGIDAADGVEADFDGDFAGGDAPFQLFSFRNLINFLLGFSWTGISCYNSIASPVLLVLLSTIVGIAFVALFFLIIRQLMRLAEDNSFRIEKVLHKTATVYLTIPAAGAGKGKIQLSVNGAYREIDAITTLREKIETGAVVRITGIESRNLLIVEKI